MRNELQLRRLEKAVQENPWDIGSLMELANGLAQGGQYALSAEAYQKVLALHPRHPQARFELGLAHLAKGSLEAAVREWLQILDEDGDWRLDRVDRAAAPMLPAAEQAFRTLRDTLPETAQQHFLCAVVAVGFGWDEMALDELDRCLVREPAFEGVHFLQGLLRFQAGRFEEAIAALSKAAETHPDSAKTHYALGAALEKLDRFPQAVAAFQRAVKQQPRHAKALFHVGRSFANHAQWDQAAACFRQTMEYMPSFAPAHMAMADVLEKQYKMDQAMAEYQRAVELDPQSKDAHFRLGLVYKNSGRGADALAEFRNTLELDPTESDAHYFTGITLTSLGRHKEAIQPLEEALRLNSHNAYARYGLGMAYLREGRFDEALGQFRQSLELNPRDAQCLNGLGQVLLRQGQYAPAILQFERALEINPQDPQARYLLGSAYLKSGRLDQAVEQYLRASQLTPDSAYAHFSLGATLSRIGAFDDAMGEFQKAADLMPATEADAMKFATLQLLAAIGIEHAQQGARIQAFSRQLEELYLETVRILARAIDARDPYTLYHSERTAVIAERLAQELGFSPEEARAVRIGGYLHDVGKLGIPDSILRKPGGLVEEERFIMQTHPELGREILEGMKFPWDVVPMVACHHERWDGTGYPHGLKGDAIPLTAQLIAAADFLDALTTHRPYRDALSFQAAYEMMNKQREGHFAPRILDAMERILGDLVPLLAPMANGAHLKM